jgi:hypothetical protein
VRLANKVKIIGYAKDRLRRDGVCPDGFFFSGTTIINLSSVIFFNKQGYEMKTIIAFALALTSLAASADVIKLTEFKTSRDTELYRTTYRVNKELKRAWIEVTIAESSFDDLHYSDVQVKVPGLSYSPEINGVVYNLNGKEVVCGTFYNSRWTIDQGMSFRETGRCNIATGNYVKSLDDGFNIRNVKTTEVILTIR